MLFPTKPLHFDKQEEKKWLFNLKGYISIHVGLQQTDFTLGMTFI